MPVLPLPLMNANPLPLATPSFLAWITNQTIGTLRNNFSGAVGAIMAMPSSLTGVSVHVVALGRWVTTGNSGTHVVGLTNNASGGSLPFKISTAVTVNTVGATPGSYAYTFLPTPLLMTYYVGNSWTVESTEVNTGDQWGDINTLCFPNTSLFTGSSGAVNGAPNSGSTVTNFYVPCNLLYTIP